jgi:hypothetical protein
LIGSLSGLPKEFADFRVAEKNARFLNRPIDRDEEGN